MKHQVSPNEFRIEFVQNGKPLPDMNKWDRTIVDSPVGPPRDAQGKVKTYI
jgi:hypothetical protein